MKFLLPKILQKTNYVNLSPLAHKAGLNQFQSRCFMHRSIGEIVFPFRLLGKSGVAGSGVTAIDSITFKETTHVLSVKLDL